MAPPSIPPVKTLLAYLLLVLPPIAALLLVLDCGKHLKPPRSIGGTWLVDRQDGDAACRLAIDLRFAQSGPRAQLRAGTAALSVAIDGDRVTGSTAGCELAIDARLDGDELAGTLQRCRCPTVAFHATRSRPVPK